MTDLKGSTNIRLPRPDRVLEDYALSLDEPLTVPSGFSFTSRIAYAAAHVVIDPLASGDPIEDAVIDFPSTLACRRRLWSMGFRVAEAMDTAQRGMGLSWDNAKDLIRHSTAESKTTGGPIACGANTDQISPARAVTVDEVIAAYEEQCSFIEQCGGQVILMASRALAQSAKGPEDYLLVYGRIFSQLSQPASLQWLGEAFDPALRAYWGGTTVDECMETCLTLIRENRAHIDGVKVSLLDKDREIEMRRRLPEGVRMYTGDDFHYPELIEGDSHGYSDALLGIFDAIAPAAARAFEALDRHDTETYHGLLSPTLALSRRIFQKPTYYYKTGLVFLAYLNGQQDHFRMLGGQENARSIVHLASLFILADQARLLSDRELAAGRMRNLLAVAGVC